MLIFSSENLVKEQIESKRLRVEDPSMMVRLFGDACE